MVEVAVVGRAIDVGGICDPRGGPPHEELDIVLGNRNLWVWLARGGSPATPQGPGKTLGIGPCFGAMAA